MRNVMSVDVEDYFHPSEVQSSIGSDQWDSLPSRVVASTGRTLDLLEQHDTKATCFVLGWVAEKFPSLVRRIADAGHEVACHSYAHRLVYDLTPDEFRRDTERAVDAIAQACGQQPRSYRAPSYSITRESLWALEILVELGFTHDSSIYPIRHDRYGIPGFPRSAQRIDTPAGSILEVPAAAAQLSGSRVTPVGGGAYLRVLPYRYTAAGIRRLNDDDRIPAVIYFHPWEIDSDQPRLANGWMARLRTYAGLSGMESKLDRLMSEFQFASLDTVFPA